VSSQTLIDRIAGHPTIYDGIQRLAGRETIARTLGPWLSGLSGRVLDVGGGTGTIQERLHRDVGYVCVDLEVQKLLVLKQRSSRAGALLADGTALPFGDASFNGALFIGVLHHLSDDQIHTVAYEIVRVLKPGGQLIVLDAVWAPRRLAGRVLWAMDRGSFPRRAQVIEALFRKSFRCIDVNTFHVLHEYCVLRCHKEPIT
jgi:ubiquinone/menaquinone biosynthesis C-methylase UbiE